MNYRTKSGRLPAGGTIFSDQLDLACSVNAAAEVVNRGMTKAIRQKKIDESRQNVDEIATGGTCVFIEESQR